MTHRDPSWGPVSIPLSRHMRWMKKETRVRRFEPPEVWACVKAAGHSGREPPRPRGSGNVPCRESAVIPGGGRPCPLLVQVTQGSTVLSSQPISVTYSW